MTNAKLNRKAATLLSDITKELERITKLTKKVSSFNEDEDVSLGDFVVSMEEMEIHMEDFRNVLREIQDQSEALLEETF